MSKYLPKQPSLEHLKNEAKALLRLAKTGDAGALVQLPEPRLALAQLVIARDYGFPSWAALKRAVEGYGDDRSALFAAIRAGDRDRADRLLDANPSLIAAYDPEAFGTPTIVAAANRNDRAMIDLLIRHGVDLDARSDWWAGSFGALDFANPEISAYLLSKGATLTAHAAARLGMADELRQLIKADPSVVNQRGGDGQYPLHFALNAEIVDILLDAGADIDARDIDHEGTPAQTQVLNSEVLHRLVEQGAGTDIFMAVALDDLELLKVHLVSDPEALNRRTDEPGNPNIPQAPGIHIYTYKLGFVRPYQAALRLERRRMFDYLYEVSTPGLKLAMACCDGNREAAMELMASDRALLDKVEQTLVCEAARTRDSKALGLMLEVGFGVDTQDREGFAPAHWAGFHGRVDLLEMILPYGPNLELKNIYGGSVLGTCRYGSEHAWHKDGNHARCIELLMEHGALP